MPVNEQERSLRRRIVFNAMNGNATPQAIHSAIQTLDSEFGDVENLRFNQLIQRLQSTLDSAEANLGKVLGEIMSLRTLPAEEIGPDPLAGKQPATTPNQSASGQTAGPRTGLHAVFATLVETIASQLQHRGDDSHLKLANAITSAADVIALGDRVLGPLKQWQKTPVAGGLQLLATPDQYRVIVHVVYVWLCQKLGPVDADRLLAAGVRQAESLPDAVSNPPRQLL
ncbi:MAG: hypothetical protein AAGA03_06130 [Planctomycetota bacterium]